MKGNPLLCVDHVALVEERCLVALGWAYYPEAELSAVYVRAPSTQKAFLTGAQNAGDLLFGAREDVRLHLGLTSSSRLGFAFLLSSEHLASIQEASTLQLLFRFSSKEHTVAAMPRRASVRDVEVHLAWYTEAERQAVLQALDQRLGSSPVPSLTRPSVTPAPPSARSAPPPPVRSAPPPPVGSAPPPPVGSAFPASAHPASARPPSAAPASVLPPTTAPFRGSLEKFESGFVQGWAVSTSDPAEIVEVELCIDDRPVLRVRADKSRGDVARRGLSAGLGGYRVAIPLSPTASGEEFTLTARELRTGTSLGRPLRIGRLPLYAPRHYPGSPTQAPRPVTVVVTVYDAAEEVRACLESVQRNTRGDVDVVVIDDASPSPETQRVLELFQGAPGFRVYQNPTNRGYTATVNLGIGAARPGADVILLNSDTRVPPRWIQTLRAAAYSGTRVGTATAISNNAGAFSVPLANQHNSIPGDVPLDTLARRVTQGAAGLYPEVPTGSGFCLFLRRDYLDEVGFFDEAAFPRGYGEENDLCMRGVRLGWTHVVDDRTYVAHTRSASFKAERAALVAQGRAVVDERYPEYTGSVRAQFDGPEFSFARIRAGLSLESPRLGKPRLLFVISTTTGGTPQTNRDLMGALASEYDPWLLRSDAKKMTLEHLENGALTIAEEHVLAQAISPTQHTSDEYDHVLRTWLWRYAIELVHVRHIAWHSLGLTAVAKALDIPVVFSFHDYYTVCPSVKLLDEKLQHCGGACTPWAGTDCTVELWSQAQFPRLKGEPVLAWRARMERMLSDCSAFITTSESAARLVEHNFPRIARRGIEIIPHGRDFDGFRQLARAPAPGEKARVVVPGNIGLPKGALVLKELIETASDRYDFHLVGEIHPCLQGLGTAHGRYARNELPGILERIGPSVGLILSIWPETYCHTLTELWASGIPVIGFDMGAVGDRMRETAGGWLVEEMTAAAVVQVLDAVAQEEQLLSDATAEIVRWQANAEQAGSIEVMAGGYVGGYRAVLAASVSGLGTTTYR